MNRIVSGYARGTPLAIVDLRWGRECLPTDLCQGSVALGREGGIGVRAFASPLYALHQVTDDIFGEDQIIHSRILRHGQMGNNGTNFPRVLCTPRLRGAIRKVAAVALV